MNRSPSVEGLSFQPSASSAPAVVGGFGIPPIAPNEFRRPPLGQAGIMSMEQLDSAIVDARNAGVAKPLVYGVMAAILRGSAENNANKDVIDLLRTQEFSKELLDSISGNTWKSLESSAPGDRKMAVESINELVTATLNSLWDWWSDQLSRPQQQQPQQQQPRQQAQPQATGIDLTKSMLYVPQGHAVPVGVYSQNGNQQVALLDGAKMANSGGQLMRTGNMVYQVQGDPMYQQQGIYGWQSGMPAGKLSVFIPSHLGIVPETTSGSKLRVVDISQTKTLPIRPSATAAMEKAALSISFNKAIELDSKQSSTYTLVLDAELKRAMEQVKSNNNLKLPQIGDPTQITVAAGKEFVENQSQLFGSDFIPALKASGLPFANGNIASGSRYSITGIDIKGGVRIEDVEQDGSIVMLPGRFTLQLGDKYGSPQIIREMLSTEYISSFSDDPVLLAPKALLHDFYAGPDDAKVIHSSFPRGYLRGIVGEFGPMLTIAWPTTNEGKNVRKVRLTVDISITLIVTAGWAPTTTIAPKERIVSKSGKVTSAGFTRVPTPESMEKIFGGWYWPYDGERTLSLVAKIGYGVKNNAASKVLSITGANMGQQGTLVKSFQAAGIGGTSSTNTEGADLEKVMKEGIANLIKSQSAIAKALADGNRVMSKRNAADTKHKVATKHIGGGKIKKKNKNAGASPARQKTTTTILRDGTNSAVITSTKSSAKKSSSALMKKKKRKSPRRARSMSYEELKRRSTSRSALRSGKKSRR